MCMKYVNATVRLYSDIESNIGDSPMSFRGPFDGIKAIIDDAGNPLIGNFKIVTQINLLGSATPEHAKTNIVNTEGALDVVVRLTKCDSVSEKRLSVDLDEFVVDVKELRDKVGKACFPFLNFTRITDVKLMQLEAGFGAYVIKVLVKRPEEVAYTIQSLYQLRVVSPTS